MIRNEKYMLVLADVPGLHSKSSGLQFSGAEVLCWVDTDKSELVISGVKTLYHRRFTENTSGQLAATSTCREYSRGDEIVHKIERRYGKFERRIPIPNAFEKKILARKLVDGELQVVLKRVETRDRNRDEELL